MVEKTPYQQALDEKKIAWDSLNGRYVGALASSTAYGLSAVRSAFLLNGGILFAMPAYVSTIRSGLNPEIAGNILMAAGSFVSGIICAALCCLFAYLNLQWHAHYLESERLAEFSRIDQQYDTTHVHRLKSQRASDQAYWGKSSENLETKIVVTFWAGILFAIFSYVGFVIGCYFSAYAILLTPA